MVLILQKEQVARPCTTDKSIFARPCITGIQYLSRPYTTEQPQFAQTYVAEQFQWCRTCYAEHIFIICLTTWTIPVYKTTSSISSKCYTNKKSLSFYFNTKCNLKKAIHKEANVIQKFYMYHLSKVLQPEPKTKNTDQMLSPHPRPHVSPCGCKCVLRSVAVYEQDLPDRLHLRPC